MIIVGLKYSFGISWLWCQSLLSSHCDKPPSRTSAKGYPSFLATLIRKSIFFFFLSPLLFLFFFIYHIMSIFMMMDFFYYYYYYYHISKWLLNYHGNLNILTSIIFISLNFSFFIIFLRVIEFNVSIETHSNVKDNNNLKFIIQGYIRDKQVDDMRRVNHNFF